MPSSFVTRFLRRRVDRQESSSSKPTADTPADPPPPYAAKTSTSNETTPAPTQTQPTSKQQALPSIQICPHETLSFERAQRIVNLKGFKTSYQPLDALTLCTGHEDRQFIGNHRLCRPSSRIQHSIEGHGSYKYTNSSAENFGTGLELKFEWTLRFGNVRSSQQGVSEESIRDLLVNSEVMLCPHLSIASNGVVKAIRGILDPKSDPIDPIEAWEAGGSPGTVREKCEHCSTKVKIVALIDNHVKIETKRYLGKCKSPTQEAWLAQCG